MDDINIPWLTEMILLYIKNSGINLDGAFRYLQLLFNDNIEKKLLPLIYIVYKLYNRTEFVKRVMDVSNGLNNLIIKEILTNK